ncbi:hypothetical protein SAMN04488531_0510 [Corynebacterium coyleae]|uniref:HTH cro/C1-type domain-containing protein n=1 Tax=Corynebacterium coyleae TaxID=53374 RepID=A0ABX8KYI6_9CORY|nr:hypothetical protein [Corynebacterium coyleae]QXB18945.1 hypothetical protein I6L55_02235 [Corynebacterium coyleae]WJY80509.1 hypothetical protein CCOY_09635 [Corynebacterium coyleae]SEB44359.1 hypothetical protein SAMN04488531_0510 [Corynebacterium coyleae]
MTQKKDWSEKLAATVAAEISRLRKAKKPKWSIKRLADETARLGYPIGQSVLSNIEYGRRGARLDVAELLVLAAALDVPPARLLWPNYPDGFVEYLPDWRATAEHAALIFTGRLNADFSKDADVRIGGQVREVDELVEERLRLNEAVRAISLGSARSGDFDFDEFQREVRRISERREEINKRLNELGYTAWRKDDGEG